jgi:type II secretion system protein D
VKDPKANPVVPNVPLAAPPGPKKQPVPKPPGLPGLSGKRVGKPNPDALAVTAGQVIDGSNWDDQDVADEYTKYTGRRVLLSSSTQNLEIRFYQRGPLTNSEAAILLEKVLGMEGYAFVPSGANEVKLLPKAQGGGANAPEEFEDIIDNPNDIPEGDAYISYFMRLNFIKPEEAVRTFTQSINGLGPGAKIAPVPNASAIIITGKAAFIRKLLNQKHYIDVAAGNVSTVWVQLEFGDAEEIAATLNEIVNAQQQRKTTAGVTNAAARIKGNRPPVPGGGGAKVPVAGGTSAGEDIPVQIVASPRLNKLFIMGRPVDIVFVEGLAREFDAPPNHNNFIKRKLRFMIASDFLQVASDALSAVESTGSGSQGRSGGSSRRKTKSRSSQQTNNSRNTSSRNGGGRSSGTESVQEFNVSDVPESMVIGKTLIVADNLANSILVQGPPESLRIVSELIDKLDGRPQQVMISCVFGDMSLGNMRELGVSWGAVSNADPIYDSSGNITGYKRSNGLGAGTINVNEKNPLANLISMGTTAGLNAMASGGLNLYGQLDNVTAVIRALETHTDFKVLSRPTVYTANNRKAVISSGRRIAVPTNTFTSGGNVGGATQSTNIEYRDVLLRFEVVPLINSEEEVTLRISLLNEDTQDSQIIDGNEIPTIVTESISTTVTIPNGSTVVLGGLVTEKLREGTSGVPILSSIPLLGRLFRSDATEVNRRELLIFMQPSIISGDSTRDAAQRDMENRYKVSPALKDFADGEDVLPTKKYSSKGEIPKARYQNARPSLRYPTRR